MDRPSPKTLVVIQTDPMKNHRAVEALRIALGLGSRSEEHTSELQSPCNLVCRLLLEKKKSTTVSRRGLARPSRPGWRERRQQQSVGTAYGRIVVAALSLACSSAAPTLRVVIIHPCQ